MDKAYPGIFEVLIARDSYSQLLHHQPRVVRNPNVPGSRVNIPARAIVKIKSSQIMRQRVVQLSAVLAETLTVRFAEQNSVRQCFNFSSSGGHQNDRLAVLDPIQCASGLCFFGGFGRCPQSGRAAL
jgi:hypothetical protein